MSNLVWVIAGTIFGFVLNNLIAKYWRVVHGYFRVNPIDKESGTYGVSISINHKENLAKAKTIMLTRDKSQD